ncbi:GNAT family N-acetyltransferase [Alloyangia pacifica]|uniref:Putative acetyltransferase n=1 Tax=Alloyangia pacifica TaxID=311180 RepID=A0A1I6V866_9RHOB|nr:GNAT family N-acetyltransferase [Alloyangia pacifica]SDH90400.1 putative acetyltransferase [Alloyangia pacifica]SFT09775.1 putative acetyltransferase [Alloyangia pacifica]
MSVTIRPVSPRDPRAEALLLESHALMDALFPPEENYHLDLDALCAPAVTLFGADENGVLLGCAAIARHGDYAEVKSMFVSPEARGLGLARKLLEQLETVARDEGIAQLRLETGDKLPAAVALYESAGFALCGPFGGYVENSSSLFYEKTL